MTLTCDVVDLFAGPGGWDLPGTALGLDIIGIEKDKEACQTRRAAGLRTYEGSVLDYGPAYFDYPAGLIASPPCQTFSMAGKGAGRAALTLVLDCIDRMARRVRVHPSEFDDERTALVLEPLRWALEALDAGHPFEWLAFEQVPTVLPVWEAMAAVLDDEGYSVDVGKLTSEQYGVPQTRKRAILIARHDREVKLPAPTHRAYRKGVAQTDGDQSLLPWVSMADALPHLRDGIVGFPRLADTPSNNTGEDDVIELDGTRYRARDFRSTDVPAQVVTAKVRSWQYRSTPMPNATVRQVDEPAPTVVMGHEPPRWVDPVLRSTNSTTTTGERYERTVDAPAQTITGAAGSFQFDERSDWPDLDKPACSVQGDPRIARRGHHDRQMNDAVRVSVAEALVIQSFPADYPLQGSKTKQYQQVGNAIPPLLALPVLSAVTGVLM